LHGLCLLYGRTKEVVIEVRKGSGLLVAIQGLYNTAIYGMEGIPEAWINGLLKKEGLLVVCEQFANS